MSFPDQVGVRDFLPAPSSASLWGSVLPQVGAEDAYQLGDTHTQGGQPVSASEPRSGDLNATESALIQVWI